MKKILLAATIALMGMSSSANAGFVDTDWKTTGDGLASLHEETGLEWLDFTQTIGLSINGVKSLLDTTYEGWRLPSQAEVNHVFHVISGLGNGMNYSKAWSSRAIASQAEAVIDIFDFGYKYKYDNGGGTLGIHVDDANPTNSLMSGARVKYDDKYQQAIKNHNIRENLDYSHRHYSVFLVSDGGTTLSSKENPKLNSNNANAPSAVSAPLALGLMSFGMLAFSRRKIKYPYC
jgi:opacity protein-like surface antigen